MKKPTRVTPPEDIAKVWRAINAETCAYVTPIGAIAIEQNDGVQTKTIHFWVDDLPALSTAVMPLLPLAAAIRKKAGAA